MLIYKRVLLSLCIVLFNIINVIAQTPVYFNPRASVEYRVDDLISKMSLDEKVGQMIQADLDGIKNPEDIKTYFLGSTLSGGDSDPSDNSLQSWTDAYDLFQQKALETRLKIPIMYGVDAVHGHSNVQGAVIFPHNIGMGCTGNPDLVEKAARITAIEMAATGIDWTFSPCIAVPRDERWGRTYEGFGETPELAELHGAAAIRGYQGDSLSNPTSVVACAKHFLGDGGTKNGIDRGDTQTDETTLRKIHLPGYVSAIQNGVGTIMASYSSWNGEKMHGNKYLLTDLLKKELGFEGFVVSDWNGIYDLPGEYPEKVEKAINSGIDMIMEPNEYVNLFNTLKSLALQDRVTIDRINDAVSRILRIKFRLGLFERPFADRSLSSLVGSKEHREVARQCVRESLVLLKKKDGVLPLPKKNVKILVAGSHANNLGYQCGGWTIRWQGDSGDITIGTTILEAIKEGYPKAQVVYSEKGVFSDTSADYSIVVIGEKPYAEGRGNKTQLNISESDIKLIKKIKNFGHPVIVILITGRPLILEPILHYSDVIFAAWLPGTEGKGITDVLFGDFHPKGVLSITWPRNMDQIPINYGDKDYNPLYEYGYGINSLMDSPYGSAPELLSSIIKENCIELTFNKPLKDISALTHKLVVMNNHSSTVKIRNLSLKENDSTTIILKVDGEFTGKDKVTIEYSGETLGSADGGILKPFEPVEIYNEL